MRAEERWQTMVKNEDNELLTMRTVTSWRIYMDYRKLNKEKKNDHYPLSFIDQMLDHLVGKRCMIAIFYDMVEDFMEIFMDDISISSDNFNKCLNNLSKVLKRWEEAKLVFSWEKYYFMVIEGIVLGHKISHCDIKVDKCRSD
ncbi:uncharacterized protein LOC120114612 [Hibiscus syriacus]|uniref:uncharacterized protein LOC120114612 n=1 Tax=Hibiscus syriacus TaxID=106335 RepID=UPI0019211D72|nr:uncharacterized protein LOC120114612 [Hibiscus syriacus]